MAKTDLTAQRLRQLLDYDANSGVFRWADPQSRRVRAGDEAGTINTLWGRRYIGADGRRYFAHRLAWLHAFGEWPSGEIDHIDGDPLNNAIQNLRDCSRQTNQQNQSAARRGSKSGVLGAHWHSASNCWRARIYCSGKFHHIGLFDTAEEAGAAYLAAKRKIHAGCTI